MNKILFVCEGNAARSQLAEGFLNNSSLNLKAKSAGVKPAGFVAQKAILVMKEKGIDISKQKSKALTEKDLEWADLVITVCEASKGLYNLIPTNKKIINWDIEDPRGQSLEFYRRVRDKIDEKVKELISSLEAKAL
ncbi:MAG: arsenate reductase ArsC [Candidatus Thermoplasmatota archaeon]|nr:arsenate reductase ArsC [Candidatus Thermoplasmatota archaeon]